MDRLTVQGFCERLSPFLKEGICSDHYLSQLLAFSHGFPDTLEIYHLGFEFPLYEEVSGPDFAFLLNPVSYHRWLEERDLFLQSLKNKPIFSDFFHFLLEGLEDQKRFQDALSISVAFDYQPLKEIPFSSPNFYIFPSDQCDFGTFVSNTHSRLLKSNSRQKEVCSSVKRLCNRSWLRPIAAAWMTARPSSGFRIVFVDKGLLAKESLDSYLEPSNEKDAFLDFLEGLNPYLERTKLLVDEQSIGVECYVSRTLPVEEQKKRWQTIFTHASKQGLMKQCGDLYLSWFGGHTEPNSDATRGYRFVRVISHVKFIYQPGTAIKMKVYLGAHYRIVSLEEIF